MLSNFTTNAKGNSIKVRNYIICNNCPCKVLEVHKSKTGKHGSAKLRIVAVDIFTKRKYEDWFPSKEQVEIPEVKKYDFVVSNVNDGIVSGITKTNVQVELPLPDGKFAELGEQIEQLFLDDVPITCTVITSLGKQAIISVKKDNEDRNNSDSD